MIKILCVFLISGCLYNTELISDITTNEQGISPLSKNEVECNSKYIAHLLWYELNNYSPYYDLDVIMKTLKEISSDQKKLVEREECYTYIAEVGLKIEEEQCRKNLSRLESFLEEISKQPDIITLQKGKLYYKVLKPGSGEIVTEKSSPLLHFKESDLSGTVIRDTNKRSPIKLTLAETIKGFSEGVIGMQQGEKRTIYVHPDLAYGKFEGEEPQQLLIFEVEILSNSKN